MPAVLLRLAPFLRAQFGAFTLAQAASVEVGSATVARMRQRGEVVRLARSVYGACAYPDSWQLRWMAALLAMGPNAVVSHLAAAYLHGLEHTGTRRRPEVELTVPRHHYRRPAAVVVHRMLHLTAADMTRVGPWPITSVAWTLCSLAVRLGADRLERAVDAAVAAGSTTGDEFAATAARFRHCPGMPVIQLVLARHLPGLHMTRSQFERWFFRLLRDAGLPLPEVNVRVIDAAGNVRYLDFAYPQWRIAIEIDVHDSHLRALGRHRDGGRQNDLVPAWVPLRFDEFDLRYSPSDVVAQVRRALLAAGAPL